MKRDRLKIIKNCKIVDKIEKQSDYTEIKCGNVIHEAYHNSERRHMFIFIYIILLSRNKKTKDKIHR